MNKKTAGKIDSLSINMDKRRMKIKKQQKIFRDKVKDDKLAFNSIENTIIDHIMASVW
jgi:hypothetical protein